MHAAFAWSVCICVEPSSQAIYHRKKKQFVIFVSAANEMSNCTENIDKSSASFRSWIYVTGCELSHQEKRWTFAAWFW